MVKSQHKRLVSNLRKKGKLSLYTKAGIEVPLKISCPKKRKRITKVEGSEPLCSWLKKRHPTRKRVNRANRSKKFGGSKKVQKKSILSDLEKQIVTRLERIGVDTSQLK